MAGDPIPNVDPATLVGQEVETFTLGMSATGTVLAVDASPVEAIAEAQLTAAITPGYQLVEGSIRIEVGEGTVTEGLIDFPVTGSARQLRPLDAATLEREILGLSEADAVAALAPYRRDRDHPVAGVGHLGPDTRPEGHAIARRPGGSAPTPTPTPTPSPRPTPASTPGSSPGPPRTPPGASRYHRADADPRPDGGHRSAAHRIPPVTGRLLGVDLGSRRIGLAVADAGIGIARPLATANRATTLDGDVELIGRVCREQGVIELVIGLPVEASGRARA